MSESAVVVEGNETTASLLKGDVYLPKKIDGHSVIGKNDGEEHHIK